MSNPIYLIYKLVSPSGKCYIGQTKNLKRRIARHKNPNSPCINIRNAIQKYGYDNFVFEILVDNLTLSEANILETKYIIECNSLSPNGYNLNMGGNNKIPSSETKQKIRESLTGMPHSTERTQKRVNSMQNRSESERQLSKQKYANTIKQQSIEQKIQISQKRSNARIGKPSPTKGRKVLIDPITKKRSYLPIIQQ